MTSTKQLIHYFVIVIALVLLSTCASTADTNTKTGTTGHTATIPQDTSGFYITSSAVENGKLLANFMCEKKVAGKEPSIPLAWENIPEDTKSLAIVMYHIPAGEAEKTEENPNSTDKTAPKSNTDGINSYLIPWSIDPSRAAIAHGMANKGPFYMDSNKDRNAISYSSPCSRGRGVHEYTIAIFALAEPSAALPTQSSLEVDYTTFIAALEANSIIDSTELTFIASKEE